MLKVVEALHDLAERLLAVPYEVETQPSGFFILEDSLCMVVFGYLGENLFKCHIVKRDVFGE